MKSTVKTIVALLLLLGLGTLGLAVNRKIEERKAGLGKVAGPRKELAVPVEVAPVERGTIENRRVFSGTLAAHAQFIVAPKVAGRIERVAWVRTRCPAVEPGRGRWLSSWRRGWGMDRNGRIRRSPSNQW